MTSDQQRQQEVVSWVMEAVDKNFLETTSQRLVLDIRKALSDYDSNWIYME